MVRAGRKLTANSACLCTGGVVGQQAELDFAGHGDVALELLLLALDGLVEARVFNGDGDLRGHGGEGAHVVFIEEGGARVFEIEDADDAVLVEERNDELGARLGDSWGDSAGSLRTSGTLMGRHSRTAAPTRPLVTGMRRMGACA